MATLQLVMSQKHLHSSFHYATHNSTLSHYYYLLTTCYVPGTDTSGVKLPISHDDSNTNRLGNVKLWENCLQSQNTEERAYNFLL